MADNGCEKETIISSVQKCDKLDEDMMKSMSKKKNGHKNSDTDDDTPILLKCYDYNYSNNEQRIVKTYLQCYQEGIMEVTGTEMVTSI